MAYWSRARVHEFGRGRFKQACANPHLQPDVMSYKQRGPPLCLHTRCQQRCCYRMRGSNTPSACRRVSAIAGVAFSHRRANPHSVRITASARASLCVPRVSLRLIAAELYSHSALCHVAAATMPHARARCARKSCAPEGDAAVVGGGGIWGGGRLFGQAWMGGLLKASH